MNRIKIELDIGERKFELAYEIPDVTGEIRVTDQNESWIDEHLRVALRPVVGRTVLRYRREVHEPTLKFVRKAAGQL